MEEVRTILLHRSVYADNDAEADTLRSYLKDHGVFLVNLMSSPGAGKTTTLTALINSIKNKVRVGVMEADIDSNVDGFFKSDLPEDNKSASQDGVEDKTKTEGGVEAYDSRLFGKDAREKFAKYLDETLPKTKYFN